MRIFGVSAFKSCFKFSQINLVIVALLDCHVGCGGFVLVLVCFFFEAAYSEIEEVWMRKN